LPVAVTFRLKRQTVKPFQIAECSYVVREWRSGVSANFARCAAARSVRNSLCASADAEPS